MQRFSYGDPEEEEDNGSRRSRRRNGGGELRNLDQYSTDEEFNGGSSGGGRRRNNRRYNMRENRRTINHYEAGNERAEPVGRRDTRDSYRRRDGGRGGRWQ